MTDTASISLDDQIRAVKRELRQRGRVYARLVSNGRMTQEQSDHEIAAMEAVLDTITQARDREAAATQQGTLQL